MKHLLFAVLAIFSVSVEAQVGIGTASPNSSAQLDISSTDKGMLIPRMTAVQVAAIASPATGLLVFQIDNTPGFYYYSGTAWAYIGNTTTLSSNLNTNTRYLSFDGTTSGMKMLPEGGISIHGVRNSSVSTIPELNLQLDKSGGFVVKGAIGTGTIPATGYGDRMMWHAYKGAFRVGGVGVGATNWDEINVGFYSLASGFNTTASGNYATSIGYNNTAAGAYGFSMGYTNSSFGTCAVAIGYRSVANGDYSIAIGQRASANTKTGVMVMSDASNTDSLLSTLNNQFSARYANGYRFFTNATKTIGATLAANANAWATTSDSTKKENYATPNHEYFLKELGKLKIGSWNYKVQDKTVRHYGAMAQEIFSAFGKDRFGIIGNDTTLATADMDGVMMIMLQGLEKRSAAQAILTLKMAAEMAKLKQENFLLHEKFAKIAGPQKGQQTLLTQTILIDQQSNEISALTAEAAELRKIKQRLDTLEKVMIAGEQ